MWGQLHAPIFIVVVERFTPTCVGTTECRSIRLLALTVHPHVCGDNAADTAAALKAFGSPPRVWGQHGLWPRSFVCRRFTPTCVGTTHHKTNQAKLSAVHPHVCGDNVNARKVLKAGGGSPPRVWGQHHPLRLHHPTNPVHPHVCGDNDLAQLVGCRAAGSPPRVWGQLNTNGDLVGIGRFTPTCVGTTFRRWSGRPRWAVHPHVCGDNSMIPSSVSLISGSPPRVWGQRSVRVAAQRNGRFTPTCVGTTVTVQCGQLCNAVHPHVCGDNWRSRSAQR